LSYGIDNNNTITILIIITTTTTVTITAARDQAISINYFQKKILKQEVESRCQLCKEYEETIDHLTLGCPTMAKNEYIIQHDKVCTHLHYSICKKLGSETTENWYSHIFMSVTEHEYKSIMESRGTNRKVMTNRPDTIVKNKKGRTCLLIDVAIPSDRNVIQK
jgi:hypothetical protein